MKSVLKLLVLALLLNPPVVAQNLVLNPGLDTYITCPGFGQFSNTYIANWSKPSIASSDYYHYTCAGIHPTYQFPRSGEGYAGIIAYNFGQEYREYITGMLSSPLQPGKTYEVEFWVSLHNGYIQAINELGAYLSASPPGPFSNVLHIAVQPQIENTSVALNDTANWRRVWGTFTAAGGEQYITIGNFRSDSLTTITQPGSSGSFGAYYFIDDVSVVLDSTTSINEQGAHHPLNVWYSGGEIHIQQNEKPDHLPVAITDLTGKICATFQLNHRGAYPVRLSPGIYMVRVGDVAVTRIVVPDN